MRMNDLFSVSIVTVFRESVNIAPLRLKQFVIQTSRAASDRWTSLGSGFNPFELFENPSNNQPDDLGVEAQLHPKV
jgi:hypothetical protein